MQCGPHWCSCTESYVDKGLAPEGEDDSKGEVIHSVWEHPSPLTQRTMQTDKRSMCAANSRRSSESLTLSALFGGTDHWPKPEIDGNEEDLLQENWLGTARKRGSQERLGVWSTGLRGWMRRKVARSRCRYVSDGFDLDLAYVTSKIIAMGFPGRGSGACFRNPQKEVRRFLHWAHRGSFRIYNLCSERSFRENGFEETVCFPCVDHCPPDFADILAFCRDVEAWLKADERNVAVIHCKAGKGRSGTMISALLLYAGAVLSARDALHWFGHIRGGTRAGVTIPSQIRWIAMFEIWLEGTMQLLSDPIAPGSLQYRPCAVLLRQLAANEKEPLTLQVAFMSRNSEGLQVKHKFSRHLQSSDQEVRFQGPLWDQPDGMIVLTVQKGWLQRRRLRFKAWWHHAFLHRRTEDQRKILVLDLPKACVDGLQRDAVEHALTPADFRLSICFEDVADA